MTYQLAAGSDPAGTVAGFVIWAAIFAAYWTPTIVAMVRRVPAAAQVVIVNLFLGWTGIGWVVALVMAFRAVPAREIRAHPTPPLG